MQNSLNEDQEKRDQSQKTLMEDSPSMTIEFLRARLQTERSISRTAKQRADELAKRVVELEEQLRIVALQRKKAEKATTEVLAILKSNGISDFSEEYDSSCDQEEERLTSPRPRRKEAEDLSGLELEASPVSGRSLSWKNCTGSPDSLEKKKCIDQARNRSSFTSIGGSSTKQCLGKSCCHIKRRETRSAAAAGSVESLLLDTHENGVATGSGDVSNYFKDMPHIMKESSKNGEERVLFEGLAHGSIEEQRKENNDCFYFNGRGRDEDMESALEHQAQLIDKNEALENAQREWEQKFRENNSCTPDSCEPGNRSDITEERDEIGAETAEPVDTIPSHGQGGKSGVEGVCHSREAMAKTLPNGCLPPPHIDMGCSQDRQCSSPMVNESQSGCSEFSFPSQDNLEAKSNVKQSENNSFSPSPYGSSQHHPVQKLSSFRVDESLHKRELSGIENKLQLATYHGTPDGLGGVMEALQRAKLSLTHELHRLPSPTQGGHLARVMDTPVSAIKAGAEMEIPIGYAGLFRVPTSLQSEATTTTTKINLLGPYSDSGSSLTRYHPTMGVGVTTGHQYATSPNLEMGSGISIRGPFVDNAYMDNGMGLPASSRYTYPSYADLRPGMPTNNGFPRINPSARSGMPATDRYSVHDDQFGLNTRTR